MIFKVFLYNTGLIVIIKKGEQIEEKIFINFF